MGSHPLKIIFINIVHKTVNPHHPKGFYERFNKFKERCLALFSKINMLGLFFVRNGVLQRKMDK